MRKLSARCVPRLLTFDHKRNCVSSSQRSLVLFDWNPELLIHLIIVYDIWIYYSPPETKQQSKRLVYLYEAAPKKINVGLSANNIMAKVFWDTPHTILIDHLHKTRTFDVEYYSNFLERFSDDLTQKFVVVVDMIKLNDLDYQLLHNVLYSSNLTPSDFLRFPVWRIAFTKGVLA